MPKNDDERLEADRWEDVTAEGLDLEFFGEDIERWLSMERELLKLREVPAHRRDTGRIELLTAEQAHIERQHYRGFVYDALGEIGAQAEFPGGDPHKRRD